MNENTFYFNETTLNLCRAYEKKFSLAPNKHWQRFKQYITPDHIRKSAKNMWSFGVGHEIYFEQNIISQNKDIKIYTWDPTPVSLNLIKKLNIKNIQHTPKAYDPTDRTLTFYTIDRKGKVWSLENYCPELLVDTIKVETESIKSIANRLGKEVDLIKADIEGRWYEICTELFNEQIKPKCAVFEFEMYFDEPNVEFKKLDEIIEKFQSMNYKVFTNRINKGPHVELIFTV